MLAEIVAFFPAPTSLGLTVRLETSKIASRSLTITLTILSAKPSLVALTLIVPFFSVLYAIVPSDPVAPRDLSSIEIFAPAIGSPPIFFKAVIVMLSPIYTFSGEILFKESKFSYTIFVISV